MRIIIMLSKKIQVTENVSISVARLDEKTLKVDIVRLYYKGKQVRSFIPSVNSPLASKTSVGLYTLLEEVATEESKAFLLGCYTQKEIMETLKGLKNIREDLTKENQTTFSVYLKAFDAN